MFLTFAVFSLAGYFVSECSCVDETTCDGTDLFPGNINYCRAGHRAGVNRPTRVCVFLITTTQTPNQFQFQKVWLRTGSFETSGQRYYHLDCHIRLLLLQAIAQCKAVSGWSVVIVRGDQFEGQYVSCPHGYVCFN